MNIETGRVVAVCMSREHGFPTYPQDVVSIGILGIEGDAHSGELRESFREPGTLKRNDRPISIVDERMRLWVNQELGLNIQHGDFNEQVVVEGLGDMGDFEVGTVITFDSGVTLEVVDHAQPCTKLEAHNGPGLIKALAEKRDDGSVYSKRGILCKVITPGDLKAGNVVTIHRKSGS